MIPEGRRLWHSLFSQIDSDNSGVVTHDEWDAAVQKGLTVEASGISFSQIDLNNDGIITVDEWNAAVQSAFMALLLPPAPSVEATYDFADGANCGQGLEIVSSEACEAAADTLGITYGRTYMKGKWKHTPPGCFVHKRCTQGCALHFGTGNGKNNGNFRAICIVAQALPLFAFSESGVVDGCPADYSGIFEVAACKEAATYLGSGDQLTSSSISSAYAGCYYNHKYAYFNTHPSPDGSFHEEHAGQICMLEHFFEHEL